MKKIVAIAVVAAVAAFALACAGCTSPVRIVRSEPDKPETRVGLAYPMPFTQFDMTVTRVITACDAQGATIGVSAEAGPPRSVPDPSQTFTIDPNSMTGAFLVGQSKVEYSKSGAARSFNAAADDRTAQVIAAAVPAVLAVAEGTGGLATLFQHPATAGPSACSAEVMNALESSARPAAKGASVLRDVETFAWPPDAALFGQVKPAPPGLPGRWAARPGALAISGIQLRFVDEHTEAPVQAPAALPGAPPGIPYRMPRAVRLQVCEGDCAAGHPVMSHVVNVLQAGATYYLPCQSKRFASTGCSLALDEAGMPVSAGTEQKGAPAEGAAGAAKAATSK